jgi:hypothetical protein
MILASVNAKKRLGALDARKRFGLWLERREVTLVVVQEGWRAGGSVPPPPPGMLFLDGDAALAAWIREGIGRPRVHRSEAWWQTVLLGHLAIHSVHLDPYTAAKRIEQLQILAERLPTGDIIVLGDFNLAPRLVDGIYGTLPSRFTSAGERRAFAEVLATRGLADATCAEPPEYTLSRQIRRSESSFGVISRSCRRRGLLPTWWRPTRRVPGRTRSPAIRESSCMPVRAADRPIGRAVGKAAQAGGGRLRSWRRSREARATGVIMTSADAVATAAASAFRLRQEPASAISLTTPTPRSSHASCSMRSRLYEQRDGKLAGSDAL